MSKLPNAPLNEVIFELHWEVKTKEILQKNQYLHGDLHSELKRKYPHRELLVPYELPYEALVNKPTHRFRTAPNEYPLYQVGPGVLTFNTVDDSYDWKIYQQNVIELIEKFIDTEIFLKLDVKPSLSYLDFFSINFKQQDVVDFVNKNFEIQISQTFLKPKNNANDLLLGLNYPIELGGLSVNFQRGNSFKNGEGFLLQTKITGEKMKLDKKNISKWLHDSHEVLSKLFKDIVKKELFESFK